MKGCTHLRWGLPALVITVLLAACAAPSPPTDPPPADSASDSAAQAAEPADQPTDQPAATAPAPTSPVALTEQGAPADADEQAGSYALPPLFDTALMRAVVDAVAQQIGADAGAVTVASIEAVTWPDGSLGCPQPGMVYTQAEVPGYRLVLGANGDQYEYHLSEQGGLVGCAPTLAEPTTAPETTESPAATAEPTTGPTVAPPVVTLVPIEPIPVTLAPLPVTLPAIQTPLPIQPLPVTVLPLPTPAPTLIPIQPIPITLVPIQPTP